MLSDTCKPFMLSVIMLSVVAPFSSATKRKKVLQPCQQTESGKLVWEGIRLLFENGMINRRLLVPNKIADSFCKFDDVILAKVDDSEKNGKPSVFWLQRLGRESATK
jgi:hypothetical protein